MMITPVAPCYMKTVECARWKSLKLGSSVPIKVGDVCSLLPEKCWFKIISVPDTMEENNQIREIKRKADDNLNNEADTKKVCLSSNVEAVVSPSEALNDILNDKDLPTECQNSPVNENKEDDDSTMPVLQQIYSASLAEGSNMPATSSKISMDSQNVTEPSVETDSDRIVKKEEAKNIILTNEAATNVETEKKIKWDCGAHFSDQTEEAASPVHKNPRLPVAKRRNQAPNAASVSREKCLYGVQCYRKNPNHKNNYSHPNDPDYDEVDDREECPYGVKCYRKNPQHKAQFKHTAVPRRRRRAATPVNPVVTDIEMNSSTEESVDESDYEPSIYTDSSDDWDDNNGEWDDGTTG